MDPNDPYGLYANLSQSADIRAWAQQAAQQKYWEAQAQGSTSSQALDAAKFAWQQTMDTASQTGKFNGQWNNPQEQWFTTNFGQWYGEGGAPGVGAQTMAKQQQDYAQSLGMSNAFGQYYAPGTAPDQGAWTLDQQKQAMQNAQNAAQLTGWYTAPALTSQQYIPARANQLVQQAMAGGGGMDYNQAIATAQSEWGSGAAQTGAVAGGMPQGMGTTQTLAGQQQQWQQAYQQQVFQAQQAQLQQQNAQNYLQMLSNLRGPADWAKYQQVLGSTPQGMRDLYAAAMGQYTPGGGATTGQAPQAANLNTMQQQIAGNPGQATATQSQYGWNGQGNATQSNQVWGSGIGTGSGQGTGDQAVQATGNGTNMYGSNQQQYNLPAPNQISAQSWNNFTPSQQQMLMGQYENAGWDKNDVQALYNQSLPKYASNNATAGTWRLQ